MTAMPPPLHTSLTVVQRTQRSAPPCVPDVHASNARMQQLRCSAEHERQGESTSEPEGLRAVTGGATDAAGGAGALTAALTAGCVNALNAGMSGMSGMSGRAGKGGMGGNWAMAGYLPGAPAGDTALVTLLRGLLLLTGLPGLGSELGRASEEPAGRLEAGRAHAVGGAGREALPCLAGLGAILAILGISGIGDRAGRSSLLGDGGIAGIGGAAGMAGKSSLLGDWGIAGMGGRSSFLGDLGMGGIGGAAGMAGKSALVGDLGTGGICGGAGMAGSSALLG